MPMPKPYHRTGEEEAWRLSYGVRTEAHRACFVVGIRAAYVGTDNRIPTILSTHRLFGVEHHAAIQESAARTVDMGRQSTFDP